MIWSQSFPTERATFWHSKQHKHPEGCFSHIWKLVWFHWDGKEYLTSVSLDIGKCILFLFFPHIFQSGWFSSISHSSPECLPLESDQDVLFHPTFRGYVSRTGHQGADRTPTAMFPWARAMFSPGTLEIVKVRFMSAVFFFFSARLLIG